LDPLSSAVQEHFGLSYLFPYQRLVVANILEAAEAAGIPICWPAVPGETPPDNLADNTVSDAEQDEMRDRGSVGRQIIILPTGAGKSLCFQLPAMLLAGPTLVIYPILSLMADQERRLQEQGLVPVILRGGQSREERKDIWERLRSGQSRFIIANPEVLLSAGVMENLHTLGIVHVVIDEAHCVSEWGESFRPSYLRIGELINAIRSTADVPLISAFTATASAPVLEKIEHYLFGGQGAHRIIGNPDRSNISFAAQGCILRDLAVRDLLFKHPRPALVFCSSRLGTEKLARYLRNELADREIRFYHAGLSRGEKTEVERWFFHKQQGILIATCAYGMGVDKGDIRTVIHRNCPPSVEAYLQESGRAGRDGLPAKAILLWGPDDEQRLQRAPSGAERIRLAALLDYARNTTACRREALLRLLNYDGPGDSPPSGCCDVCEGRAATKLRETESITSFFQRNRRRYTLIEAAAVLAQAEALHWSEDDAKRVIKYLLTHKTLRNISNRLWKGKLTVGARLPAFPGPHPLQQV
jgi:ATP-dependent DNA helicase RecQ